MSRSDLFSEFPEVSAKAWKQHIQFNLQGEDYNQKMVWESPEGIKVKPFYHTDDIKEKPLYESTLDKKWNVGQTIYAGNAILANEKALDTIERGAESIILIIPSEDIKIETLLKDINLNEIPIHFEFQFLSLNYIKKITDFTLDSKVKIHFNIDIIGHLAEEGNWFFNLKQDYSILNQILQKNTSVIRIDASLYQNAGANMVQQLTYALAHANEYLNYLDNSTATQKEDQEFTFKVAVGSNYFFEIAKLRALRLLWDTLASAYGAKTTCTIIATPSRRNKTIYDFHTNMLRTTTECMAAILGEADMISNLPYDAVFHKDNEFGERIARNQLILLKEEAGFSNTSNPSNGVYYIESLTEELAEKALVLFKNIEASGGYLKHLKEHTIQKKIKESATKEQELFNTQQEVLVGTNTYKNPENRMKNNLEIYPFVKTNARKTLIEPIIERRLAEELEQKRLKDE